MGWSLAAWQRGNSLICKESGRILSQRLSSLRIGPDLIIEVGQTRYLFIRCELNLRANSGIEILNKIFKNILNARVDCERLTVGWKSYHSSGPSLLGMTNGNDNKQYGIVELNNSVIRTENEH